MHILAPHSETVKRLFRFLLGDEIDEYKRAHEKQERIEEIRDHVEGRDAVAHLVCRRERDEHLCAVGDDALKHAGERVEQGSGLSLGDAVALRHLRGDRVCHDDGDGVVRGGDVHRADEQTHAELTAFFAPEELQNAVQERLKAAVLANERADRGNEDRDHRGLKHAGCARAHAAEQLRRRDRARGEHDDRARDDADQQHHEHVDAEQPAQQHQHIGDDLDEAVILQLHDADVRAQAEREDEHERHERGGQGDGEVLAELVLHLAALTVAGGDGRVGDKGEVVAEHRAAHDGADAKRQGEARGVRRSDGDRGDERDRADARAHRGGDKAAHHKEHRHGVPRGNDREHEVRHALGAAASDDADEDAGLHEDQDHRQDVLVADALSHERELLIKGEGAVLQAGDEQRREKHDHDRDIVKPHRDLEHIFKQNAEPEIEHQEHADGQQRCRIGTDLFFVHRNSYLLLRLIDDATERRRVHHLRSAYERLYQYKKNGTICQEETDAVSTFFTFRSFSRVSSRIASRRAVRYGEKPTRSSQ